MSGRRKALIVANDEYQNEGLRQLLSPAADAEALGRVLGDAGIGGFDVQVVRNEPAHVVSTHIEDLFSEGRPDDVLLLHFSGHGLKNDAGELFFAAANTRPNRLGSTAVPASFVQRCMHASRSRSVVLLLDCCYGGAFGQGVAVRASGDVNVLDSFPGGRLGGGRGRAVISASTSMEYAFEGDRLADGTNVPSVFTSAVVDGLSTGDADRDEDGWVSLNDLYDYVFDRVRERNPNQTPSRDVQMQGEFYLARSRRRRIQAQPLPPDLRAAVSDANMFTRIGAVSELRVRLLDDNVAAAVGAHEALREIASTDIRYVADAAQAALQEARLRPDERELRFGVVDVGADPGARLVRLQGPPVARAPTFRPSQTWIRVTETADGLAVSVDTSTPGMHRGELTVTGPTGEVVLPVEVEVRLAAPARSASQPPEHAPAPASAPASALESPPVPEPEPESTPQPTPLADAAVGPGARTAAVRLWVASAVLAAAVAGLFVLTWPGSTDSRLAWSDSDTGWHVFRTPLDTLLCVLAFAAAVAAPLLGRGARIALGIVAGCGISLAVTGLIILIGGISADQFGTWIWTTLACAGITAVAWFAVQPDLGLGARLNRSAVALIVVGGLLELVSQCITYGGVSFLAITHGMMILDPLTAVTVAWLAIAVADRATGLILGVAEGTAIAVEIIGYLSVWAVDQHLNFLLHEGGSALLLAGIAVGLSRRPRHGSTRQAATLG